MFYSVIESIFIEEITPFYLNSPSNDATTNTTANRNRIVKK